LSYKPSLEEFIAKAEQGNLIPVYREILADMETPVSAFTKIDDGGYSYLLESVEGGEKWARYCFLGARPSIILRSKGRRVELIKQGRPESFETDNPLQVLKELMARYRPVRVAGLPRFFGGAVGYIGYDMVRFFERLPDGCVDDLGLPDAVFIFTDTILIFDNVNLTIKVVSNVHLDGDLSPEKAYEQATERIDALIARLRRPIRDYAVLGGEEPGRPAPQQVSSNMSQAQYMAAVERAKEYIQAGDILQVVLAQRFTVRTNSPAFDIYRALRSINPSPYMFYLKLDDLAVIGSSPEVLVRVEEGGVEVRPIAGTRGRGMTEAEDKRLEKELVNDEKERAEHLMLVDLGRNDVGRVAEVGSVEVSEFMVVERYSHVMHLVSNVKGRLGKGKDAFEVLQACFPAGTVSGAPKIRAMEIIDELEPTRRGPYAGAVGYFSFSGNLDTCITIRTILVKDGRAYVQAGAGIVADSVPQTEYQETLSKARALLRAIELAEVKETDQR
jgi:anthranilate synthase component 1